MQMNCSITHSLNQSATDEELRQLASLIERNYFRPYQKVVVACYVSRQTIQNYVNEPDH